MKYDKGKELTKQAAEIILNGATDTRQIVTILENLLASVVFNIAARGKEDHIIDTIAHFAKEKIPLLTESEQGKDNSDIFLVSNNTSNQTIN